jgi:Secretion system C-terminal sorting domain
MKNYVKGLFAMFYLLPMVSMAQSRQEIKPLVNDKPQVIIDYGGEFTLQTRVPFKGDLLKQASAGRLSGANAAVFEVTYINFGQVQQDAFQYAVDIWSSLLQSDVIIRITAVMSPLGSGVLGQTTIPARYANFDNAQKINSFYTVAMAEKIAGHDLNDPADPDIIMEFNNDFAFYYGTDLNTPSGSYDFTTIVLHEIGHGLGFSDGTFESGGTGFYTVFGIPTAYDRYLENGIGENIVDTYDTNTPELGDQLTSDDLFFKSFLFPTANDRPKLYAPFTFNGGSSIAHLDEATYPPGNSNSLMTPQIGPGEAIHDPGVTMEMFRDMGWEAMDIDFIRFTDSEDSISDRTLTLTAIGDSAVIAGGVNLHYTYSDFVTEDSVVNMTPTGNANEYTAIIPATGNEEVISYYVNVDAEGGKPYTSPGEAPNFSWNFVLAKDTIAPIIEHEALSLVFLHDPVLPVEATVIDNINAGNLSLTYRINGGVTTTIDIPLITSETNGFYQGEYSLNWDIGALGVVQGDSIEYRLEVEDLAANPNAVSHPETGFHRIQVEEINPAVAFYENDFNIATSDFIGSGFTIGPETGFNNDALHSDHPYRTIDGTGPNDTLVLYQMLKTPIILSAKDASLVFDEIVLIEPGENGTIYGDDQFWDFVIVEGSNNLGVNWHPLADGYDSRAEATWLTQWNSNIDGSGNSLALGDPGLFIKKEINMTDNNNFVAGDTLLIRFRIHADQLAHGWGWAIDNLKLQIDEKPPVITQITPDYMFVGDTGITLKSKVEDNTVLDSVIYEITFNGNTQLLSLPGDAGLYTINLTFSPAIAASDILQYRIIAVDSAIIPNTTILPDVGFFEVPVVKLEAAKSMYVNDFNTTTDDFIGNNFSIVQPDKFTDPALVSTSTYPNAPFGTAVMSYLLKYPITLNQNSSWVQWDEMVLVEPGVDKVAFEVSKDGGATWIAVFDPYDASEVRAWNNLFDGTLDSDGNSTAVAEPAFMEHRFFDMLQNPEINGGEEVLVRFSMTVNDNVNGWGWVLDNFEIQGPTTGIEDEFKSTIQVYPNPTNTGYINLQGSVKGSHSRIVVTDVLGKIVKVKNTAIINSTLNETLDLTQLKSGIYMISVNTANGISTARVVIE